MLVFGGEALCSFYHSLDVDRLPVCSFLLFRTARHPKLFHQSLHFLIGVLDGFREGLLLDSATHPADKTLPEVDCVPLDDVFHEVCPFVAIFEQ